MKVNEKELKKRLIIKRQNVRKKLNLLKHGEIAQESAFSPITKHLKNIESKLQTSSNAVVEPKEQQQQTVGKDDKVKSSMSTLVYKDSTPKSGSISTPLEQIPRKLFFNLSTPTSSVKQDYDEVDDDDDDEEPSVVKQSILNEIKSDDDDNGDRDDNRFQNIAENSYVDYLEQYDTLPRKYINEMYHDSENKDFDHKYGIRHDRKTEKFLIGDSRVEFIGNDIFLKNKRYKGTLGLYELLFKKQPKYYNDDDIKNYKQIILKTNAHRRYYKSNMQIDGSKLRKYKKIIAPITTGKGMLMKVTDNKITDYIYWNDPNELINRLRLLIASQEAGHTGHRNEINSIIEELQEAHIIV